MTQLALDLNESRRRKRAGMELTASVNSAWIAEALEDLRRFASNRSEFPMEAYRASRKLLHLPEPTSSACWGAFTMAAQKAGVIRWTGKYVQASSVKTHSHVVRVWVAGAR